MLLGSTSQIVYTLPDGRIFRMLLNSGEAENIKSPLERRVAMLELDFPGQAETIRNSFYGENKPRVKDILKEQDLGAVDVQEIRDVIGYSASPYVNSNYRRHRKDGDLSSRALRWHWREGILEFEDRSETGSGRYERKLQNDLFSRDDLDEFVGNRLRLENRRSFLEMQAEGVDISGNHLQDYLREKFPESRVVKIEEGGEEADTFIVRDPRGQDLFIAKEFRRASLAETPEMLTKDQVLSMWRGQKAIEASSLQNIRYVKINAVGPGWMLREYIPAENLGIGSVDVDTLRDISRRIDDSLGTENVDLKFVSVAIQIAISSSNLGHNLARETLPDGSVGFVIYDPL